MFMLHQEPTRAEAYRQLPLRMSPDADFIPVADPLLIQEVLASPVFEVENGAGEYQRIGERTGNDFSSVVAAFDYIPLTKEGGVHRDLREAMSAIIATRAKHIAPRLRADLSQHLAALLMEGRQLDLVADIAVPTYASLFSVLLGVDAEVARDGDVSEILNRLVSLNRRKRLERSVKSKLQKLREAGLPADISPEIALAMTILGRDPLVGSMAMSLWLACSRNPGQPLDLIDFEASFGSTGVPIIDRFATSDTSIGGHPVPRGTRLRLYLDATSRENASSDAGLLFGKGRHLCLGKPLALIAWRVVTGILKTSPLRARPVGFAFRRGDFLFNHPEYAHVELHR